MPTRLLITGAGGMLGQDVAAAAIAAGVPSVALARAELDITDSGAVAAAVTNTRPHVVVNCAAWTDVDGAESAPDAALAVNGAGAGHVARAAAQAGAWVLHVSSDYVFDGAKGRPYVESDPTGPRSAYGRTKLAGEVQVARHAPEGHTIIRSSWLFGAGGPCFPETILRLAAERDRLSVVDDQIGCPTFTGHLAQALVGLAAGADRPCGIVHVAGGGSCSWYEFAVEIVQRAGLAGTTDVAPCSTAEMPRPAQRPAYSVLGSERRPAAPELPDWRDGLEQYMGLKVPAR
jgi:dTDP-4-dehydrorhamnose reductase